MTHEALRGFVPDNGAAGWLEVVPAVVAPTGFEPVFQP